MQITLDSRPAGAPGCVAITAPRRKSVLIQTDTDYPAVASAFGWSVRSVQSRAAFCCDGDAHCGDAECADCNSAAADASKPECDHRGTDGTVDCRECGCKAGQFIAAAREWIDAHDGATADDPGYFDGDGEPALADWHDEVLAYAKAHHIGGSAVANAIDEANRYAEVDAEASYAIEWLNREEAIERLEASRERTE